MGKHNRNNTSRSKSRKKRRSRLGFNWGVVTFLVIVGFIGHSVFDYVTKPRISIYEVNEKQISNEYTCTGLALRQETVVKAGQDGYLNYYFADGTRIAKNSTVYTVDQTGEIYKLLSASSEDTTLNKAQRKLLWDDICSFRKAYHTSDFTAVTNFAYDVENTVMELTSTRLTGNIDKILKKNNLQGGYVTIPASQSGIICYSVDGYEDRRWDSITEQDFSSTKYSKKSLRTSEKVSQGDPVYKLVTGEEWDIVIDVPKELYQKLSERVQENLKNNIQTSEVTLTLSREGIQTVAPYELFTHGSSCFMKVALEQYGIHYISDRYLDLKVSLSSVKGLKIPTSSIVKKEFYVVPMEYLITNAQDKKVGVTKEVYDKSGDMSYEFVELSNYFTDDDNNLYIDTSLFSDGEWLHKESSNERTQLAKKRKLKGVYNINYGYCVFKRVKPLYENGEYCIVEEGVTNGISNFDHIVVDAKTVSEDDLINSYKS